LPDRKSKQFLVISNMPDQETETMQNAVMTPESEIARDPGNNPISERIKDSVTN
jgi:hypothetical protein